jgi:general stress protein 26
MRHFFIGLALLSAMALPSAAQSPPAPAPSRANIAAGAKDIIEKARYATLITIGLDGHPQARIVDPMTTDANFITWIATNPLTRKVNEIRRNPRVTLLYFDTTSSSYVTLIGRAALVTDDAEKAKHWKDEWSPFYETRDGKRDVTLIRLTPSRLEVVSPGRGLVGDPRTWLPLSITFPERR